VSEADRLPSRLPRRRALARALWLAALLTLGLGLASVRVVVSGERELVASTEALRRGNAEEATVRARRAAGWYAPGAPHVRVAYERLRALGREAELHRRFDLALLAWRAIRTAALETRWLLTPHAADLELANREIARIMAMPVGERGTVGPPDAAVAAAELETLARAPGPRLGWTILLCVAFGLGVVGFALWARQMGEGAATATARTWWRAGWARGRTGALLTAVALGLWLLALWRA
jgi:hypothetical protein